ncbi:hypothetical protein NN561_003294 [Cricetulus griseus]
MDSARSSATPREDPPPPARRSSPLHPQPGLPAQRPKSPGATSLSAHTVATTPRNFSPDPGELQPTAERSEPVLRLSVPSLASLSRGDLAMGKESDERYLPRLEPRT